MKCFFGYATCLLPALAAMAAPGHGAEDSDGFRPLFNGRDLAGWRSVNTPAATFTVRDGAITSSGSPMGFLVSERMFENFVLELEWRNMIPGGNSGLFLWCDDVPAIGAPYPRGIEIQMFDPGPEKPGAGEGNNAYTRQGAVFPIRGATMTPQGRISDNGRRSLPSERRTKPAPAWNHYRLVCVDGEIRLSVNGREVTTGRNAVPRKGHLAFESELGEAQYRNIRIKELPASDARPDVTASSHPGFRPLFNGADFTGWKYDARIAQVWSLHELALSAKAGVNGGNFHLWTEKAFRDFELIVDWRLPTKPAPRSRATFTPDGLYVLDADGKQVRKDILDAGDSGILLRGSPLYQVNIWSQPMGSGDIQEIHKDPTVPAKLRRALLPRVAADAPAGEWNRFEITLIGDRVTVKLNGQHVVDRAVVPGLPVEGPIGLQYHRDAVEFMNIFVKQL